MKKKVTVTILGCRGSVPVSGSRFARYGGATGCVLVRGENAIAVLDAGTGLLELSSHLDGERSIPVFLSHCHTDHLLGLPICPEALNKEFELNIYGATHDGRDVSEQVKALISPPLWPVNPSQLPASIVFHDVAPRLELNGYTVDTMEGCHPGGVTVYRLTINNRRIVYMTDCTINDENRAALLEFSRDCDLLLCDGHYSDEQWLTRSAFGHNRWSEAARFGVECGAKRVRILHHDPTHSDQILDTARSQVQAISPICDLAFVNEEIAL